MLQRSLNSLVRPVVSLVARAPFAPAADLRSLALPCSAHTTRGSAVRFRHERAKASQPGKQRKEHVDHPSEHKEPKDKNLRLVVPKSPFEALRVPTWLAHRLEKLGIKNPTRIQVSALPALMRLWDPQSKRVKGSDVIIEDFTGSGKTLTFLVPMLSNIDNKLPVLQAVVVVPTRELALQMTRVAEELLADTAKSKGTSPLTVYTAVGEVNPFMIGQLNKTTPHLLIATLPVAHELLIARRVLDSSSLKYLALDEIDYLASRPSTTAQTQLKELVNIFRPQHIMQTVETLHDGEDLQQLVFVSATITEPVLQLAKSCMRPGYQHITAYEHVEAPKDDALAARFKAPKASSFVAASSSSSSLSSSSSPALTQHRVPSSASHLYLLSDFKNKRDLLVLLLCYFKDLAHVHKKAQFHTVMVFFNQLPGVHQNMVDAAAALESRGLRTAVLSELATRQQRRDAFRDDVHVILTTDVLARGMDFKNLTHVINFEVPVNANTYLHRAGRVGRLNSPYAMCGTVLSIASHEIEAETIDKYQKNLGVSIDPALWLQGGLKRVERRPQLVEPSVKAQVKAKEGKEKKEAKERSTRSRTKRSEEDVDEETETKPRARRSKKGDSETGEAKPRQTRKKVFVDASDDDA